MSALTNSLVMLSHAIAGVFTHLALVWLYVESLNASEKNQKRIKLATYHVVFWITLSFVVGGFWYINYYPSDKEIILKSNFAFAHKFFMETKEHIFFILLILAYYLPFVTLKHDLSQNRVARKTTIALVSVMGIIILYMEGAGAIIGQSVKLALSMGVK